MDIENRNDIEGGEEILEISAEIDSGDEIEEESRAEEPEEIEETVSEESDASEEAPESAPEAELAAVREEIFKLREELTRLEALREKSQKMLDEFDEFIELFPEKRIENLPDEVWKEARAGASIAAAYALYEKRREAKERLASQVNAKNAALSAGKAGDSACEYFSYEQVKGMSQAEVRRNYTKIRESMKKWN